MLLALIRGGFSVEAAVGVLGGGIVESEGEMKFGIGVFEDDVEGADGGAAIAFDGFVADVSAGDAGVGFDGGGFAEAVFVDFEDSGGFCAR